MCKKQLFKAGKVAIKHDREILSKLMDKLGDISNSELKRTLNELKTKKKSWEINKQK